MIKENIVVVGGYGHVGRIICTELSNYYPGKVYAAGRSQERAAQFSADSEGKIKAMQIDIHQPPDSAMLDHARLVIMCLDQTNTDFVRSCLQSGTHYIDISADASFLTQVEKYGREAEASQATAVLSVGLAPGLTNLLALQARQMLDRTDAIDISLMLGLGDRHGRAAIEWTVDNLNTAFAGTELGRNVTFQSFTDGKIADFGLTVGRKRAYRFPFSDQQTLPHTLDVPSVSTRLCFDSTAVTVLMAGMRASGISGLLKRPWARNATVRIFERLHVGSDHFAAKIDARGIKNGKETQVGCSLYGRNQSDMTARAATFVANALYSSVSPYGVYHIEQLYELSAMRDWLGKAAIIEIQHA